MRPATVGNQHTWNVPDDDKGSDESKSTPPSSETVERWQRVLLAGAFPFSVTGAILAIGLLYQVSSGRANIPPATMAGQMIAVAAVAGVASMATVQVVKSL